MNRFGRLLLEILVGLHQIALLVLAWSGLVGAVQHAGLESWFLPVYLPFAALLAGSLAIYFALMRGLRRWIPPA